MKRQRLTIQVTGPSINLNDSIDLKAGILGYDLVSINQGTKKIPALRTISKATGGDDRFVHIDAGLSETIPFCQLNLVTGILNVYDPRITEFDIIITPQEQSCQK